jgi:hypothetical protein
MGGTLRIQRERRRNPRCSSPCNGARDAQTKRMRRRNHGQCNGMTTRTSAASAHSASPAHAADQSRCSRA